jgi:hypothetical protein
MKSVTAVLVCFAMAAAAAETCDVVVYGGTAAGVMAAVQVKRMGKSVVLVCPERHLGGLSSGGLGFTDTGNKAVIGGLAREFYHRIWKHYDRPEAWRWQSRGSYGNKGQGTAAIDGTQRTMWIFEPHVAEQVFEDLVREHGIPVMRGDGLERRHGVQRDGTRIVSLTTKGGKTFRGGMFIDATYEGDLMASAGASWHAGREAQSQYGEKWNGVQTGVLHHRHHFGVLSAPVSPYRVPGDPASGLLPLVSPDPPGAFGSADRRIQAYCYRMCLTDHPENRVPFPKPPGYDPARYELLRRVLATGWRETFAKFDPIPNRKTDTNNHGPVSTDFIGANYDYPDGDDATRERIIRGHQEYQQGWFYYLSNDPGVPAEVRSEMQRWGLAKDEFADHGHWPRQLYIREARRLRGEFVMTEHELTGSRSVPDSAGMGSYTIDSHNVQRYITPEGQVQNEGDIGVGLAGPYRISWRSLLPKRAEVSNLIVPVCVSSSHIAFGSIRMEPVFMILAQSAATGACMALERASAIQDVPYGLLRERLAADGQILAWETEAKATAKIPEDPAGAVTVDDAAAEFTGAWTTSHAVRPFRGDGYRHDGAGSRGPAAAIFRAVLPARGRYEVRIASAPHDNRAKQAVVQIVTSAGVREVRVDQRKGGNPLFLSAGVFDLPAQTSVTLRNDGADGHVIADAVQFVPAASGK